MRLLTLTSLLFICALLICTACTNQTERPNVAINVPGGTPTDNGASGQTETTAIDGTSGPGTLEGGNPTDTGTETTEAGTEETETQAPAGAIPFADLPAGWREDIPLMEGFTIDQFHALPDNGMFAMTKGNVDQNVVYNFYKDLPGWEVDPEGPAGANEDDRSLAFKQGDYILIIAIIRENNETFLNFAAHK
ncbi:MAG: hypothetical protein NTY09_10805 [bacterium]|nr:hypothetical protein [bacterium]